MVTCAWTSGSIIALVHTLYVFHLPFCRSRLIDHFFCELPSLLQLVCHDTSQYEYTVILSGLIILLLPFLAILASYARVLAVVFQMSSGKGQTRAVSTCSSHLIVASLFYVTGLSTYTRPHSWHSPGEDRQWQCFTPSSYLFWTHLSTAWGIKRLLGPWEDCCHNGYLYMKCHIGNPLLIEMEQHRSLCLEHYFGTCKPWEIFTK